MQFVAMAATVYSATNTPEQSMAQYVPEMADPTAPAKAEARTAEAAGYKRDKESTPKAPVTEKVDSFFASSEEENALLGGK